MARPRFKHPSELLKPHPKEPVSARVTIESMRVIKKAAKDHSLSVSELVASVIEDYAEWLSTQEKK